MSTDTKIIADSALTPRTYFNPLSQPSLQQLYGRMLVKSKSGVVALADPKTVDSSIMFFWDSAAGQLINPVNLSPDPSIVTTSDYKLSSTVYNFHPSKAILQNVLIGATNNAQLTFTAVAADSVGEMYQWMVLTGLTIAANFISGGDGQSLNTSGSGGANNNLTNFQPSDQITIMDGKVSLTIGIAAQKQKSFWQNLISIFGAVENSPIFGMLPMPKLTSDTVKAITTLFGQIENTDSLIPVIQGKQVDFRITGAAGNLNPFVLKAGFWVVFDYAEVQSLIDYTDHENIKKGIFLDIDDMQYDIKDSNNGNACIDCTYATVGLELTSVPKQ